MWENRQYNFPPLGVNPVDRLNPQLPPQAPPDFQAARDAVVPPIDDGLLPPELPSPGRASQATEWQGLNSLNLPGTTGNRDGSYTILAQLPDVVVIQRNTRGRVADVNVGNVTNIEVQDWHALVTMRIDRESRSDQPAGVYAHRIGPAH